MKDSGFVEVGGAIVFDQTLEGRVGPKDREKRVMIDEEGFWLSGGRRDYRSPLKSQSWIVGFRG